MAALTRGELERAWERDVGGPCRARIYHCVGDPSVPLKDRNHMLGRAHENRINTGIHS